MPLTMQPRSTNNGLFFWVTIFVSRLEITETLLTRLINGNARQYVATFKTTELSYISIYMTFYAQLIVIDPFRSRH